LERNCDSAPAGKLAGARPENWSVWSSVETDVGFKNKYASHFCPTISQKNIVASLVPDAGAHLLGDGQRQRNGVGIDADSGGGGGQIRPPSSRCHARRTADLLARDNSYGNLRTPLHKAMAGGRPLVAQQLVRASHHRGVLWEAMRARDASGCTPLKLARAYASIPSDKAETERAWVRWWDAAAGGAGTDWATCLHLLERAATAADVARDGAVSMVGGVVNACGGIVSSFRAAN